jgi:hypothetical protein
LKFFHYILSKLHASLLSTSSTTFISTFFSADIKASYVKGQERRCDIDEKRLKLDEQIFNLEREKFAFEKEKFECQKGLFANLCTSIIDNATALTNAIINLLNK